MPLTNARRALLLGVAGRVATALSFAGCTPGNAASTAEPVDAAIVDSETRDSVHDGVAYDATKDRTETGADAAISDAATSDAATSEAATNTGVPDGWETWAEWDANCPLYVPGERGHMPPPIEWKPCPTTVHPNLVCRRMVDTWGGVGTALPSFAVDPETGRFLLQFTRMYLGGNADQSLMLVAEVDGPVRSALLQLNLQSPYCGYWPQDVAGSRYVINPSMAQLLSDGGRALERGAISGPLKPTSPDFVLRLDTDTSAWPTSAHWYASDSLLVGLRLGRHDAWTWDQSHTYTVYSSGQDPDGLPPIEATVVGSDVFSHVTTSIRCGINSWNAEHGSRPLLRWYGDSTRGAGNFATDGADMVWTYSEGATACKTDSPNPEVWTAPYTADPVVLATTAHRLRKDVRGMSADPYVVGFGYAMRTDYFGDQPKQGLFVVRLSDGVGWKIPSTSDDTLAWGKVLGFTQTELFVEAYMPDSNNNGFALLTIVRIQLDSLGPGIPPD